MLNFLLACGGDATTAAAAGNGCYDWPVIKQIVWLFSEALGYLYKGLDLIGIANIGLVIIIFTLIVKFLVLPLTIKQQKFTKLQSVMQPELQAIQNKYKDARNDQYAMQAMQAETKAVYAKYGVSQTGGCLQSFISLPVLIALYGAIRNIPTAIDKIADTLNPVASVIANASDSVRDTISSSISSGLVSSDTETVLKVLYVLPKASWEALQGMFTGAEASTIATNHEALVNLNSFLGWDISQSPWNIMTTGGTFLSVLIVLIPILAGFSQWLSFKLTQTKQSAQSNDQAAVTGKMMGLIMPLFSVYICFTLNTGLGIYWCMSSFFQVVLQILINRHYRKIDMDAFIEENKARAEEKAKKKREKAGVKGSVISSAANISTKNIENQAQTSYKPRSISDIANMNVDDPQAPARKPASNSLAAKAAMVQEYNDEHPEEAQGAKRKYKK